MIERSFVRTWVLLLLTVAMLSLYPWLHRRIPLLQRYFKSYDIPGWYVSDTTGTDTATSNEVASRQPVSRFATQADSLAWVQQYTGYEYLEQFYQALQELEQQGNTQVRIAYYGDSAIEGDLLTMTLRDSLQQIFGGSGVGFVPITSAVNKFRITVTHDFSNNWSHYRLTSKGNPQLPLGPAGEYYRSPSRQAKLWVRYGGGYQLAGVRRLPSPELWYGPTRGHRAQVAVAVNRDNPTLLTLPATQRAGIVPLCTSTGNLPSEYQNIKLEFTELHPDVAVYGVSFASNTGIILDNYSLRGNSGTTLVNLPDTLLRAFQTQLRYRLICVEFGLNILNPKATSFTWYERDMVRVIEHLRRLYPDAAILVVGVTDKSTKINGTLQTDPSIPRINQALRNAAIRTQSAYFDLYQAMGGYNTMLRWVDDGLANKDYTHFNHKGAKKASELVLDYLLRGYQLYLRQ